MKENKIIILNFMFSGKYLDDNIGHEIINIYTSDSKRKYIYLCYNGEIDPKVHPIESIEHIIFVRRTETANQIEILGFTEGPLDYIPTNDSRQYDVEYGGKRIGDIFRNNNKQQNVNMTFEAQKEKGANVYRLTESFNLTKKEETPSKIFKIKTSLRGYIYSDADKLDYKYLTRKIEEIKKKNIFKEIDPLNTNINTDLTMAEVYGIINRELPYSDALKFFIDKYSNDFKDFFVKLSNNSVKDPGKYIRTLREWRNIDLIVEYENAVFVIENKIFSKLNGIKLNDENKITDQLDKYKAIIEKGKEKESFQEKGKKKIYVLLYPDHNPISHNHTDWNNHKYSELDDALKNLPAIKSDRYLEDFERSVSYHCDTDYNYTVMNKRFVSAIKRIH